MSEHAGVFFPSFTFHVSQCLIRLLRIISNTTPQSRLKALTSFTASDMKERKVQFSPLGHTNKALVWIKRLRCSLENCVAVLPELVLLRTEWSLPQMGSPRVSVMVCGTLHWSQWYNVSLPWEHCLFILNAEPMHSLSWQSNIFLH